MAAKKTVHLAIADDHILFRNGLKSLVELMGNYKILIEAANGLELITQLRSTTTLPDICIIDLSMGPLNGYETILVLKRSWPAIKIIVLSMYDEELLITKILEAGADCYLPKNIDYTTLGEAIVQVLSKGYYHTAPVADLILKNAQNKNTEGSRDSKLQFSSRRLWSYFQQQLPVVYSA